MREITGQQFRYKVLPGLQRNTVLGQNVRAVMVVHVMARPPTRTPALVGHLTLGLLLMAPPDFRGPTVAASVSVKLLDTHPGVLSGYLGVV